VTLQDLKHGIEQSSDEDKLYLAAYLRHLVRKDDPVYRAELAGRRDEMAAGKRYSLDQLRRVSQSLDSEGP